MRNTAARRRREHRIAWVAFSISLAVHGLIARTPLDPPASGGAAPVARSSATLSTTAVVRIAPAVGPESDYEPAPPRPASDSEDERRPAETPEAQRSVRAIGTGDGSERSGPREVGALPGSAARRLRSTSLDPRLWVSEDRGPVDAAAGDRAGRAQARGSAAIAAWLDRPGVRGPDSLSFNRWGEEGDGVGLRPGILSIGGITVPFCGGADVARCGFGARPWDLDRADHEAALRRGLEEQARWEDVQDRADAVARRRAGGG